MKSFLILFYVLIHSLTFVSCHRVIRLGALFSDTEKDSEVEFAFKYAIDRINRDPHLLPNTTLVSDIEYIPVSDSFRASKKVCGLLSRGVVAIFGPLAQSPAMHVQSICDALEIPHIETRWAFELQRDDLSINLYPPPSFLTRAFNELIKAWSWKTFAIVYEENEAVMRLRDFYKEAEQKGWRVNLYQFKPGTPFRDVFWEIKQNNERNIVLDVKPQHIHKVLKHAQQVGMMTEFHSYLITSLDLHTADLEDFKFGRTKITSLRLLNTNSKEYNEWMKMAEDNNPPTTNGHQPGQSSSWISKHHGLNGRIPRPDELMTETALIYDGVKLLASALQELDQSQSIEVGPISCDHGTPWSHGSSLINYMRPVSFKGFTGTVCFDQAGFRSSFELDVMKITEKGILKIGTYSEEKGLNITQKYMQDYLPLIMKNLTLIVTTVLNEPYTMLRESADIRSGNERFEGYGIDLVEELSKILKFKYTFEIVKDRKYGVKVTNTTWNGMIGEVMRGEADMAVADLTITSKREEAVDFTLPFMNTGISILFKKPTTKVTTLFSFLSPFSMVVWVYVVGAYVGVSVILFLVGRLSPYEWDNPHPCRQDDQVLENDFSLLNSFWFTIGSLMQQGSDLAPKSMSTRTIAGIWYFFTLIMISSYTANLAAFLTVEKVVYPIESAEDLSMQTEIAYGCVGSGSTRSFFQESSIETYKRMWTYMSSNPSVFVPTNKEGRERVAGGNYAFLMESASIEYIIERNCNLTQIGSLLDSKGYGIATKKDSIYRTPLSQAILQLQESGVLHTLKDRWWKQKRGGGACADDSKKGSAVNELNLGNVGGVFVVLLGGLAFSMFMAICEFMWRARKLAPDKKSMCEEMGRDIKFALSCQSSTKAVRRRSDFFNSPEESKSSTAQSVMFDRGFNPSLHCDY